jgi:hypothetical protein
MAGGAAAGREDVGAVGEVGLVDRQVVLGDRRRHGQEPEDAAADGGEHNREQDQLSDHRAPPMRQCQDKWVPPFRPTLREKASHDRKAAAFRQAPSGDAP